MVRRIMQPPYSLWFQNLSIGCSSLRHMNLGYIHICRRYNFYMTWPKLLQQFIDILPKHLSLNDYGDLSYFLSIKATDSTFGLLLTQTKYITDLLDRTNITDAKIRSTHANKGTSNFIVWYKPHWRHDVHYNSWRSTIPAVRPAWHCFRSEQTITPQKSQTSSILASILSPGLQENKRQLQDPR